MCDKQTRQVTNFKHMKKIIVKIPVKETLESEDTLLLDSNFFSRFSDDVINDGEVKLNIIVQRTGGTTTVNLAFFGKLVLTCDRSLELFDYPVKIEKTLYLKAGEESKEIEDNLFEIPPNTFDYDITDIVSEYIVLPLPYRKIHPKYLEDDNEGGIFFSTEEENAKPKTNEDQWKDLKKFLN